MNGKTFVFEVIYGKTAFPLPFIPIQLPTGVANSIHIYTFTHQHTFKLMTRHIDKTRF